MTLWRGCHVRANDFSEGRSHAPGKQCSWPRKGAGRCLSLWCKAAYRVLIGNCVGKPSRNLMLGARSHGLKCLAYRRCSVVLSKYWVRHAAGMKSNTPSFPFSVTLQHRFLFQESTCMKLCLINQRLPELKK